MISFIGIVQNSVSKFIETDSILVVARVLAGMGIFANGCGFFEGDDKNILKLDTDDSCTTL